MLYLTINERCRFFTEFLPKHADNRYYVNTTPPTIVPESFKTLQIFVLMSEDVNEVKF